MSISVTCDRCGAAGIAGLADFSLLGDLLAFAAVPRRNKRKDGWTPVLQREFIARLAQTASPQMAADAMGKNLHGVKKLLVAAGADAFRAAWERAVELGEAAEAKRRIAEQAGLQDRSAHLTGPRPRKRGDGGTDANDRRGEFQDAPGDDGEGYDDTQTMELIQHVVAKFMRKVGEERSARLSGDVVAADFALRQVTWLEVAFDLMSNGHGLDAWRAIQDIRRDGHSVLQIAETEMSRILDEARRAQWTDMGEPPRPEHPPQRYLTDHGDYRTEVRQFDVGEDRPGRDEELRARAERQTEEAAKQIAWEASQRRGGLPIAKRQKAPKALPAPAPHEEDFADRAMRKAMEAAKRAHPEDFD
jgi:hypothetical protein